VSELAPASPLVPLPQGWTPPVGRPGTPPVDVPQDAVVPRRTEGAFRDWLRSIGDGTFCHTPECRRWLAVSVGCGVVGLLLVTHRDEVAATLSRVSRSMRRQKQKRRRR